MDLGVCFSIRYLLLLTSVSAVDDLLAPLSQEPIFFLSFPIHPSCYCNIWYNHNKLISSRIHLYNGTKLISLKESRFAQNHISVAFHQDYNSIKYFLQKAKTYIYLDFSKKTT